MSRCYPGRACLSPPVIARQSSQPRPPLMILVPVPFEQAKHHSRTPHALAVHRRCQVCIKKSGLAPTDVPNLTVLTVSPPPGCGSTRSATTALLFFYTPRVLHRPAIWASFAPFASSHHPQVRTGSPSSLLEVTPFPEPARSYTNTLSSVLISVSGL